MTAPLCPEGCQSRSWVSLGVIPCMGNGTRTKLPFLVLRILSQSFTFYLVHTHRWQEEHCVENSVPEGPTPAKDKARYRRGVQGPATSGHHPRPNIRRKEKWLALQKWKKHGTSLAVQWLRLRATTAGGAGSIPSWGTHMTHGATKKKKKKRSGKSSNRSQFLMPKNSP